MSLDKDESGDYLDAANIKGKSPYRRKYSDYGAALAMFLVLLQEPSLNMSVLEDWEFFIETR